MASPPPSRVGAYTIERELGRGGMGVVYLGRDTRLNRAVAIKAMPAHLASDPDRLSRFEREAKTLATLSHPNVAGIYGVEAQDGHRYLILEYVEGESLAERLDRGPLPVADALEIAAQIAAGVEAAHEAGVIHRDLKPGNVVVTPDGVAKVLDFGLARFEESSSSSAAPEDSPTLTAPVQSTPTDPGVILGTAAYMSPEQARGRRVDKRSDIWSFGVVLYELLTGISPFAGETAADSIGAILHRDLDLDRLPKDTPPHVRNVLQRCLRRDKAQRFRDIGDVLLELAHPLQRAGSSPSTHRRPWLLLGVSLIAAIALAGWATSWLGRTAATPGAGSLSLSIPLEAGLEIRGPIAIDPGGTAVAYGATDPDGEYWIYVRRLDDFSKQRIPGSRNGRCPAFSPDGRSLAFFAHEQLRRIPLNGGAVSRLTSATNCMGMSWGEDGTILYSEGLNSPILGIDEGGSPPETLTVLADDPNAYAHVWPQHIPGTRKVLFTSWVGGPNGGARILDLDTGAVRPLTEQQAERAGSFTPPARWSATGHIIFEQWDSGLQVLPFDPESRQSVSRADARLLLSGVYYLQDNTRTQFALSDNGVLAYVPGDPGKRHLVLVDQNGNVEPVVSQEDVNEYCVLAHIRFSPDGSKVLGGSEGDIVEIDLDRRLPRRITDEHAVTNSAYYAPDGTHVIYASNREKTWSIWSIGTAAGSRSELVLRREGSVYPTSVGPDGSIVFWEVSPETGADLWILPPGGEAAPLVVTPSDESQGRLSPDGRWLAYSSNQTGEIEIYIRSLTAGPTPIQITADGGDSPLWSRKGTALYYRRERQVWRIGFDDGRLVGVPRMVFDAPNLLTGPSYDVSEDETRMVAVQKDDEAIPDEIRIVTGYFDEIRRVSGPGSRH